MEADGRLTAYVALLWGRFDKRKAKRVNLEDYIEVVTAEPDLLEIFDFLTEGVADAMNPMKEQQNKTLAKEIDEILVELEELEKFLLNQPFALSGPDEFRKKKLHLNVDFKSPHLGGKQMNELDGFPSLEKFTKGQMAYSLYSMKELPGRKMHSDPDFAVEQLGSDPSKRKLFTFGDEASESRNLLSPSKLLKDTPPSRKVDRIRSRTVLGPFMGSSVSIEPPQTRAFIYKVQQGQGDCNEVEPESPTHINMASGQELPKEDQVDQVNGIPLTHLFPHYVHRTCTIRVVPELQA
jgi:hypothetical protein